VPWLHRVSLNLTYSRLGRRRVATRPFGELDLATLPDGSHGPAELAEQEEARRAVRDCVALLSPKHQSVVVLYYLHGLSIQETSSILGVRPGTVKSRLHYALESLRSHLAAELRLGEERRTLPGPVAIAEPEAGP
jgi:RNA polymerase sigma-70 factor (ECF subfamily)